MDDTARTGELRRKLEKEPGSRLFAQLAEELRKEGKYDEAISVARKGLEKNPNYPSARMTLARALLDSGRPREARPELEQIVKASPDNIMASRLLGDALENLGEPAQALQQFEKTLRLSPGDKAVIERIAELKAKVAPASLPEPGPAAAPAPSLTAPAVPQAAAPVVSVAAPPTPEPASVALDRDLASGTFSPGSLTVSDLQKHFEETAAAGEAPAAPVSDLEATVGFGEMRRSEQELPSVEMPPLDSDPGAQTRPLTSVTLADLYLQQGLKAEASAVLSQVLKEEPDNAEAQSKFAAVSGDLAQTESTPAKSTAQASLPPFAAGSGVASAPPVVAPKEAAPARAPRTKAEVRERSIISLKAFASAVEREMVHQKATERGAF